MGNPGRSITNQNARSIFAWIFEKALTKVGLSLRHYFLFGLLPMKAIIFSLMLKVII